MTYEDPYEEDGVATPKKAARPDFGAENQNEAIVITQVVDTIYPHRDGTESMLAAAFLRAGQFIHENFQGDPIELIFEYGGQKFAALAGVER